MVSRDRHRTLSSTVKKSSKTTVTLSILCLSLLIALGSCDNPLAETCGQLCQQTCDVVNQLFSVLAIFLGPFVNTGYQICSQGCSLVCGIFG